MDDVKAGYTGLLVKDGILYVVADTGNMHAYDGKTGEALWVHDLGSVGKGSPVWADGRLYAIGVDGEVIVLAADKKFQPLAKNPLGDMSHSTPAIADGVIYLRSFSQLAAVGKKTGKAE